jgi:hypothetical protein
MLRTIVYLLLLIPVISEARALDMSVATEQQEKLAYVLLWGPIESGDDKKFRSTILPYVKAGYSVFEVFIYSNGGNVAAAMEIGEQIRTLQTRTNTAYHKGIIINYKPVKTGGTTCDYWRTYSEVGNRNYADVVKAPFCDCASACFLIWASGISRKGGRVRIHRFSFDASQFSKLSPAEARAQYQAAKDHFDEFLKKLDIPQTILDRLYATDSRSIYELTWPELELLQSTPYLEELTLAKCGPSKEKFTSRGRHWTLIEDPEHVNCYRGILKELLREGAKNYLAKYGE